MAQIFGWLYEGFPFLRRHHVGLDAFLQLRVPVWNRRNADKHHVDFAVIEDFESPRLRQFDVLTYILRELVDLDAETCVWLHVSRTFPLLTTIPPTAEPGGDAVGQEKGSRK